MAHVVNSHSSDHLLSTRHMDSSVQTYGLTLPGLSRQRTEQSEIFVERFDFHDNFPEE